MIRLLFFLLILIFGIGVISYLITKFIRSLNHPKNKLEGDKLKFLRELGSDFNEDLVLFDDEEFKLLSLEFEENSGKDVTGKWTKGKYKSVYDEPLIAYATKDYYKDDYYLAVIKTKTETLIFSQHNGVTEVNHNGKLYGKIGVEGILKNVNNEKIGSLIHDQGGYNLIYDNKKQMVHLRNSKNLDFGNQSAYPVVEDLEDANRTIVFIMTMFDFLVKN